MENVKSDYCHLRKHAEFVIYFDPTCVLKQDAEWLIDHLESQVLNGVVFKAEQTIQIGWMVLKIAKEDDQYLTLQEPDFREIPIKFNLSVNNALTHLRMQKDTFESLDIRSGLQFPSILQSAIACTKYDDSGGFFLSRTKENKNDSGWFMGCTDIGHNHNNALNLKRLSLYELACSREELIQFMALPEGVCVFSSLGIIKVEFNGRELTPKNGSFLQKMLIQNQRAGGSKGSHSH